MPTTGENSMDTKPIPGCSLRNQVESTYQVLGTSVQLFTNSYQLSAISFQERKFSVIGYQCSVLAPLSFTVFDYRLTTVFSPITI